MTDKSLNKKFNARRETLNGEVAFARNFRPEETDKSHEALLSSTNDSVI